ncbi:MAG: ABC transporter ATP-binding protein [Thermoplasmata archaeon]|nr:ABC transporter ATP-binding protein [Thermoplasmata archaeon]
MAEKIIEMEDVTVRFNGNTVLDNVSLDVLRGDVIGIVGPNGGGKTTLLNAILGNVKIASGSIRIFGEDHTKFRAFKKIGHVSQHAIQFDPVFPATVEEIVALGCISRKKLGKRLTHGDKKAILSALELVEIMDVRKKKISALSGGQKQRVFIAKAIVHNPELLILDEATTGLDVCIQDRFIDLLQKLKSERDITVMTVSHDISGVMCQANKLAVVNREVSLMDITPTSDPTPLLRDAYGEHFTFVVHHAPEECKPNLEESDG